MNKILTRQDGFAALIAIIMVAMLTLIGLAALSTSDDEIQIAGNELQEMRAFYAAEAGLEQTASQLQAVFDSTGLTPVVMPNGTDSLNGCAVTFVAVDNGPATQNTLTSGTLQGLHALVKTFTLRSVAESSVDYGRIALSIDFNAALVPLFQFAVFYDNDLEIAPGPNMTLLGRVHTNGDLYVQANSSLSFDSYITAAGDLYHGRKGPGGVSNGDVRAKDAYGNYVSMQEGSGWLESTDAHWYDSATGRWQGRVQDAAFGQGTLNLPLNGAGSVPHDIIEPGNPDSYENKATLKFVEGVAYQKIGGVWNNVTADMIAKGIIEFKPNQFTDQREGKLVDVMELDMQKLYAESYEPANGVIYFSDNALGGNWPALRINNGSELGDALTIASANPIYTIGDYNSVNKKPAAIMADAVTFLSSSWDDLLSSGSKDLRIATETNFNASILTGNVETTAAAYNGGFENLPRFLEQWTGTGFNWSGSMVNLWNSQQADGSWNGSYYSPPIRNWSYDTDLDDPANLPPETPQVRVFQRTGWRQEDVI
ncbi:MAG: hypothetical protein P1R58_04605 [bacterium]|nr:hypothetical protein [bacterium]